MSDFTDSLGFTDPAQAFGPPDLSSVDGSASGDIGTLTLSAAAASSTGGGSGSGAPGTLTLSVLAASVAASAAVSCAIPTLTLASAAVAATGDGSASGSLPTVTLAAAAATASASGDSAPEPTETPGGYAGPGHKRTRVVLGHEPIPEDAKARGALPSITFIAPTATASGSAAVSGSADVWYAIRNARASGDFGRPLARFAPSVRVSASAHASGRLTDIDCRPALLSREDEEIAAALIAMNELEFAT